MDAKTVTVPAQPVVPELRRVLFIEEVSALIGKRETTIRTCATNRKYQHLIPRPFKMPHSRRLAWYEEDVLAWIAGAKPVVPIRKSGRPRKAMKHNYPLCQ